MKMGTDCKIRVDGEWHSLDRWYVFWQDFDVEKSYTKTEALKILRKMKRRKLTDYDRYWVVEAMRIIKDANPKEIKIVDEHRLEEYGYKYFLDALNDWQDYQRNVNFDVNKGISARSIPKA